MQLLWKCELYLELDLNFLCRCRIPGQARQAGWHMGHIALGALPTFLMDGGWFAWFVGQERAWPMVRFRNTICRTVLLAAPLLKLSSGHMGLVISLTVLCGPEISDGHQTWDERRACCLWSQTLMTPKEM